MTYLRYLRYLDVDDLLILKLLLSPRNQVEIARIMGLTPPALTHRINKYRDCIPNFEVKNNGSRELTESSRQFCERASKALDALA